MSHDRVPATMPLLVCRVPPRLIGLRLEHVIETTRPLPIERMPAAPAYVLGLSRIRGSPVPVVDASRLLGGGPLQPDRFVTLRAGGRTVALAVGRVLGISALPTESLGRTSTLGAGDGVAPVMAGDADHADWAGVIAGAAGRIEACARPAVAPAVAPRFIPNAGKIWVNAAPNQGTTFFFTLPGRSRQA